MKNLIHHKDNANKNQIKNIKETAMQNNMKNMFLHSIFKKCHCVKSAKVRSFFWSIIHFILTDARNQKTLT